jgi:hypothetical protein
MGQFFRTQCPDAGLFAVLTRMAKWSHGEVSESEPTTDLMAAAGGVAAGVAGAGLHPEPEGGAGPQHVLRRRPPYRHRPLGAPLAAVAPRLREEHGLLLLGSSAALEHGPRQGLILQHTCAL